MAVFRTFFFYASFASSVIMVIVRLLQIVAVLRAYLNACMLARHRAAPLVSAPGRGQRARDPDIDRCAMVDRTDLIALYIKFCFLGNNQRWVTRLLRILSQKVVRHITSQLCLRTFQPLALPQNLSEQISPQV